MHKMTNAYDIWLFMAHIVGYCSVKAKAINDLV